VASYDVASNVCPAVLTGEMEQPPDLSKEEIKALFDNRTKRAEVHETFNFMRRPDPVFSDFLKKDTKSHTLEGLAGGLLRTSTRLALYVPLLLLDPISVRVLVLNDPPASWGADWGIIENKHSTDVESPPPPPPRVCMSVHPEGKTCRHVRSRFECLLSMTLLPGTGGHHGEPQLRRVLRAAHGQDAAAAGGGEEEERVYR